MIYNTVWGGKSGSATKVVSAPTQRDDAVVSLLGAAESSSLAHVAFLPNSS